MPQVVFSLSAAVDIVNAITICRDVLESENSKIQHEFVRLGETFKDDYYNEFVNDFTDGSVKTKNVMQDMVDVSRAILTYGKALMQK